MGHGKNPVVYYNLKIGWLLKEMPKDLPGASNLIQWPVICEISSFQERIASILKNCLTARN